MSVFSKFLELQNGAARTVDLSTNTLSVQGLQINAATGGGAFTQAAHSATTSYSVIWPATQAGGINFVLANDGAGNLSWIASSSGSVTAVSVVTANGFAGTSSGGTTPALTLTTTLTTPVIAGNGTALIAATTTGTGSTVVLDTSPTLITPALGTPSALVGTNITGTASSLTVGNINATTNSTLTTLSALSLPTSQLTGTITAAQMLPLATNDIYVGNGSSQPAAVAMSGDATIVSTGALTLATVATPGTTGSSTAIPVITINAKGLTTAITTAAVIAPAGTLTGTTLNSTVVTSSLTSLGIQSTALNMGSNQINGLATPSISTDAATKGYVDAAISGLTWKGPVQAYANSNVPLTGSTPLVIDGYTILNGDLLLLSAQTTSSQDGEYATAITGGTYTLTANGLPNAVGDAWLVTKGTLFANSAFVATAVVPAATFIEFAGPTSLTFNAPLSLTGNTVSITQSNTTTNGYLSSTDWNTFNNKQPAGNYITALTGDATAAGPGSVALTLATVNSNIGTFASVTVNAKGLVTAAAALSGDATTSGSALTLATVNTNVGSFTNASITVNAKGLITAASNGSTAVTSVSVATANGLAGTSSGGATPTLTLSTTINSPVLAGNGTAISAATTTGTGSTVVLSASPALTGTVTAVNATLSGNLIAPTLQNTAVYSGAATLSANTTYAIRWGIPANSETAGHFYLADWVTSSFDLFWVIGLYNNTTTTATGTTITITNDGTFTLGSSDTTFGSTDQGKPVWLGAAGAFVPNSTFAPVAGDANEKLGIVTGSNTIWVSPQMMGVS